MKRIFWARLGLAGALIFAAPGVAWSLTTDQFLAICESASGKCHEHPALHAYVGGALDLMAALDEETDYLGEVYCNEPEDLFDVAAIAQFIAEHRQGYADRNAMLLFIRYFEENGGCKP